MLHLIFEMLAFVTGYQLYSYLRRQGHDVIDDERRAWIFLGAATGAWLGSHLLGLLEKPWQFFDLQWFQLLGDKTIVGGLLGGLVGVEWTKKRLGVTVSSGDLLVYPILLGLSVGRVGCHFAGLDDGTFGLPTDLPWGVDLGDGVRRHPVNLYEIVWLVGLGAVLFGWKKRRVPLPDGDFFKGFMVGYLVWRLGIEFLKPTWRMPYLGLSVIQVACLLGLLYYRKFILVTGYQLLGIRLKIRSLDNHK